MNVNRLELGRPLEVLPNSGICAAGHFIKCHYCNGKIVVFILFVYHIYQIFIAFMKHQHVDVTLFFVK
jgi:hypothetical protein